MAPEQLERILGREQLMESKLLEYLMREKTAEFEQRLAAERERERADREQAERQLAEGWAAQERVRRNFEQVVEDAMIARFPAAPLALVATMREIRDPEQLLQLHRAILTAPDQASAEQAIREVALR